MPRISSMIPSSTEIVCALGFQNDLVGRSHECDFPQGVEELPWCTEPRIDVHADSKKIDQSVRKSLENALSVYKVDHEKLKEMNPDVIVTQAQCEVCAVSYNEVEKAVSEHLDHPVEIVSLEPYCLDDVWSTIKQVAQALDANQKGDELVNELKERTQQIKRKSDAVSERPRILSIEWIEPLMVSGTWIPELVDLAGGENLFGVKAKHAPQVTWNEVIKTDPDKIIVMPCGFDLPKTRDEMHFLTDHPEWNNLKAVQNNEVYLTDGNHFFNRPGPRLVESVEILAEIIHPDLFSYGHKGKNWQTFVN